MGDTGTQANDINNELGESSIDVDMNGAAKCAAAVSRTVSQADSEAGLDPVLATIVTAWPQVAEPVRQRIIGLVEASMIVGRGEQ